MAEFFESVMDWLTAATDVFGVSVEHWMMILAAGILAYIGFLVVTDRA